MLRATQELLQGLRGMLEQVVVSPELTERVAALRDRIAIFDPYVEKKESHPKPARATLVAQEQKTRYPWTGKVSSSVSPAFRLEAWRFPEDTPDVLMAVEDLAYCADTMKINEAPYLDKALQSSQLGKSTVTEFHPALTLCRYRAVQEAKLGDLVEHYDLFAAGDTCVLVGIPDGFAAWVALLLQEGAPLPEDLATATEVFALLGGKKVVLLPKEGPEGEIPEGWKVVRGPHAVAWSKARDAASPWYVPPGETENLKNLKTLEGENVQEMSLSGDWVTKRRVTNEKGVTEVIPLSFGVKRTGRGADLNGSVSFRVDLGTRTVEPLDVTWRSSTKPAVVQKWKSTDNKWWERTDKIVNGEIKNPSNNTKTKEGVAVIGFVELTGTVNKEQKTLFNLTVNLELPKNPENPEKPPKYEIKVINLPKKYVLDKPDAGAGDLEFPESGRVVLFGPVQRGKPTRLSPMP